MLANDVCAAYREDDRTDNSRRSRLLLLWVRFNWHVKAYSAGSQRFTGFGWSGMTFVQNRLLSVHCFNAPGTHLATPFLLNNGR
jgi:hypothetical protein